MRKLFFINAISGFVQFALNGILVFITIPYLIKYLGEIKFGIYSLVLVSSSLNSIFLLGLNTFLVKYLAENKKVKQSNYHIVTTLITLLLISSFFGTVFIFFEDYILVTIFGIDQSYLSPEIILLYRCVIVSNMIFLVGQTFGAILDSLGKIYINNLLQFFQTFIQNSAIFWVAFNSLSLNYIGYGILISMSFWFLFSVFYSISEWRFFELSNYKTYYKKCVSEQFSFSKNIVVSGMLGFIFEPMTKILTSNFIGVIEVGYLEIIWKIRNLVWGAVNKLLYPLLPIFAEISDPEKLTKSLSNYTSILMIGIFPINVFILISLNIIIELWLGHSSITLGISATVILFANLLALIFVPAYYCLLTKNLTRNTMVLQLINALTMLIFFFITNQFIGLYSICFGVLLGLIFSSMKTIFYMKQFFNVDLFIENYIFLKSAAKIFGSSLLLTITTSMFFENSLVRLFILSVVVLFTTIYFYRSDEIIYKYKVEIPIHPLGFFYKCFNQIFVKKK